MDEWQNKYAEWEKPNTQEVYAGWFHKIIENTK